MQSIAQYRAVLDEAATYDEALEVYTARKAELKRVWPAFQALGLKHDAYRDALDAYRAAKLDLKDSWRQIARTFHRAQGAEAAPTVEEAQTVLAGLLAA